MAWIAVAHARRAAAATPLAVLPLIVRAGAEYWLAFGLLVAVAVFELIGKAAILVTLPNILGSAVGTAFTLYAFAVQMRVLGGVLRRRAGDLGLDL